MSTPLAYFLTWTCYGQRLHGDERGSVDREHNVPGTPFLQPDSTRERGDRSRMRSEAVSLTVEMRHAADQGIRELAKERGWWLIARNVRQTHVHVIVHCPGAISPERVMAQIKARITRDCRQAGLAADDARLWTDHGSTRWINHTAGLFGAIAYVNDWQDGPNREIREARKELIRKRIAELKEWMNLRADSP